MMKKIIACACLMFAFCSHAIAGPGYYLVSIYGDEGEKTVDVKSWTVKIPGRTTVSSPKMGFGYGLTRQWHTELYVAYLRNGDAGLTRNSFAWQNDFLLTHGQYPVDFGLHTQIERFRDTSRGYGFEFGPVLQTEFGKTQLNANLFFERNYHAVRSNRMQMKYQWQVKHRWHPAFEIGVQGFGELGEWDRWAARDQQSHRIGPVISGTFAIADERAIGYEAAYFTGSIFATHARVFTMRIKYAF